ncbi:hypothetical protein GCM10009347_41920 [Shewanella algicola]|uniref:RHS repeat-associated core domain-containing protein n=1 Tax=Shewanella algicola TaxID=640633 RepID=A0A9X2CBL2_9GAMM|nr:RHS repeat-associated core domain-containing protein [Shewanella algicola]MCL1107785.1 hypothetical protein [Shewanella algicola]GGP73009.1 hypothetical protein GCM10009347_41920 [Shewanella algicola]
MVERNNVKSTFSYDANGNRYKQVKQQNGSVVSTTYYVGSFEREVTLSSTVDKTYIGDHTIKMKAHVGSLGNQSPFQHVLRDHLGSVDTLMDAKTGAVLQHRGYDVFGRPRDIAAGNNLLTSWQGVTKGYTDHEHLVDQELIHMNGRIYDFNVGRFLSVDPFLQFPENSQSANPYSYILNNPMSGTDPTGYCQAEDNMSDCSGSLKSCETKAITDADGKRVGTVGKDSNGTTYVTSGGKSDVKDAMAFTNNTGRFKSDVGKQNSIGIKDSSTSYGNSSSFIAGYSSANKGDMTGALSLTPIGQTVDGIKSGIDALEAGYEEYQKTGDLTSAAVVAGKVGTEAYIERKLKVARLPDVTKEVNLNSNDAVSNFGIYDIEVNGALNKVGKADLNRVTKSSGLPTRLHQQVRKLEKTHGKGNVQGQVVKNLGQTTTGAAKTAENARIKNVVDRTGIVPIGNQKSYKP